MKGGPTSAHRAVTPSAPPFDPGGWCGQEQKQRQTGPGKWQEEE